MLSCHFAMCETGVGVYAVLGLLLRCQKSTCSNLVLFKPQESEVVCMFLADRTASDVLEPGDLREGVLKCL